MSPTASSARSMLASAFSFASHALASEDRNAEQDQRQHTEGNTNPQPHEPESKPKLVNSTRIVERGYSPGRTLFMRTQPSFIDHPPHHPPYLWVSCIARYTPEPERDATRIIYSFFSRFRRLLDDSSQLCLGASEALSYCVQFNCLRSA